MAPARLDALDLSDAAPSRAAHVAGLAIVAVVVTFAALLLPQGRLADIVFGAAIAAAIAYAAGRRVARRFVRPLSDAAERVERSIGSEAVIRLDQRHGVAEYRRLATAFNAFAARVEDREREHELVLEATGDVLWKWSAAADSVTWTGELESLFGIVGHKFQAGSTWWHEHVHPEERERIERALSAAMEGDGRHWSEEYRFRHSDGSYRWFWDRAVIVRDAGGRAMAMLGAMTDISARRDAEERIWHLANHDELTGLFNRKVFQSRLDAMVAGPPGSCGALLLVDIDQFKDVNDSLGHPAGDALLKSVARRLSDGVAGRGLVFRLGGDEFALILPEAGQSAAEEVARGLLAELRRPVKSDDRLIDTRATIGIALFPQNASDAATLLQDADLALYEGKARGRDQAVSFEPRMRAVVDHRVTLLRDVRTSLAAGRFEPWYQPIVSLIDGSPTGVEALMRWRHPVAGVVTPEVFAVAFDDPETALLLGDCLVERVIADFRRWGDDAPPYVAINLPSAMSHLPQFAERLVAAVTAGGLPPARLCVELTETMLLGKDAELVASTVKTFTAAGVRIALDDFGTGYASLTHLQKFPVDTIKIDRSFISQIATDPQSQAIALTVIELGRRLGKEVIAEGVESEAHAIILRAAGCTRAQGYHFARAMPADALAAYIARRKRQPAARSIAS